LADDLLQLAHHQRIGMRPRRAADAVIGGADVGDPVADRLVHRVLERARSRLDAAHLRAQQLHPVDVGALAAHVLRAHVDDAVEAEQGADGGGGDAVLPGAGLRDHPLLAHALRQQRLPERVVQLVRAGVEEVLALEVDARRKPERLRQAVGAEQRGRPPRVGDEQIRELLAVGGVRARGRPGALQLVERGDQRLGHEPAAVGAEAPPRVRRRYRGGREDRWNLFHLDASRAARTNARTRPSSLYPSGPSIPLATSTPDGRASAIACATFSALSPPQMTNSTPDSCRAWGTSDQAKLFPDPPAGPSSRMRAAPGRGCSDSSETIWIAAYSGSDAGSDGQAPWS